MVEPCNDHCKRSRISAASQSGEPLRPTGRPSVDRVYPLGMGLRPKAYPRPQRDASPAAVDNRPAQGPLDRCLTIVRTMSTDTAVGDIVNAVNSTEASARVLHFPGETFCPSCPSAECLASCAALPAIALEGDISSDWLTATLHIYASIMICMSCGASRGDSLGKLVSRVQWDGRNCCELLVARLCTNC